MKQKKTFRPHKICLGVLAVSAAILLAGQGFLQMGYPRNAISLQTKNGDAALLQDFTLQGFWQGESADLSFTMQNGNITTSPQLTEPDTGGLPLWLQQKYCVPDAEIPQIDQNAETSFGYAYGGAFFLRSGYQSVQYSAQTDHLEAVCTLSVTDGSDRSVRFSLGNVQLRQPVNVTAELAEKATTSISHSYQLDSLQILDSIAQAPEVVLLGSLGEVGLYIGPNGNNPGGVYLVREFLSEEQVAQQVSKVQIHGIEVPSATEPYGELEKVCSFEAGESLVNCQNWTEARLDGEQWLLTQDAEGKLYLRMLDAEYRPLACLPLNLSVGNGQTVTILPSMRTDEAVFTMTDETGAGTVVVLRLAEREVTAEKTWNFTAETAPLTAGFSTDGSHLMVVQQNRESLTGMVPAAVREHYTQSADEAGDISCTAQLATGWRIQVFDVQSMEQPQLTADLEFGIPQWGRQNVWRQGLYGDASSPAFCHVVGAWKTVKEDAP